MAKYRALGALYVGSRLIAAGESFSSDETPGLEWEPLDDEGHAAFASYAEKRAKEGIKVPEPAVAPAKDAATVVIPDNWRDQPALSRIRLARQLGAPLKGTTKDTADELIAAEVEKRAKEQSNGG